MLSKKGMRLLRTTFYAFTLALGLSVPALAQTDPNAAASPNSPAAPATAPPNAPDPSLENELVDGKRVWITYPGKGWLVPAGQIVGKNADGSYRVSVYEYNLDDNTRSPARIQDIRFHGLPLRTIDVPAAELVRWNTTKFNAWVEKDGKPWPKAKIIADTGDKVTVAVYDTKGENIEKTEDLTGKDLKKFRSLNGLTAPGDKLKAEIGPKTEELIDKANRDLRAAGWKLKSGEAYPRIHTLPDIVSELRAVAERYKPLIEREVNVNRVAALQEDMLREVYITFEDMAQIKHGGRPTTSDEWKSYGSDLANKARKTGDPHTPGQQLQETLLGRAISCFEKSMVAWQLVNLAEIPALTGVGFRLLSWGFHGTLAAKLTNGSWREWETTEGFEPPLTRAFKPFSVEFDGPGDNGNGLNHATGGINPMAATGEVDAPVGRDLDRSKAKVWLDMSWKGLADDSNRVVEVNVATGDVTVSAPIKDKDGKVEWKTFTGKATPEQLADLQKAMNSTDPARLGAKVTDDGRGPHFVFTGSNFAKSEGDTQSFAQGSSFRDFVLMAQTIGRQITWDNGLEWGSHTKPADAASTPPIADGASLAAQRDATRGGSVTTTGMTGLLDDTVKKAAGTAVDPAADGKP